MSTWGVLMASVGSPKTHDRLHACHGKKKRDSKLSTETEADVQLAQASQERVTLSPNGCLSSTVVSNDVKVRLGEKGV